MPSTRGALTRRDKLALWLLRRWTPLRGARRLAPFFRDRYIRRPPFDLRVRMRRGHELILPSTSRQTWCVAITGDWDDGIVDLFTPLIMPDSVVLDIGASLGLWTIQLAYASQKIGARVVAIEPSPKNCYYLNRNVALNKVDANVEVRTLALGEASGPARMWIEAGGFGNGRILERSEGEDYGEDCEDVTLARLDDLKLPAGYVTCSFIKMDVEGFELSILRGGMEFIQKYRPVIFGEFNPFWLRHRHEDIHSVEGWANAMDYEMFALQYSHSPPWRMASAHLVPSSRCDVDTLIIPKGLLPQLQRRSW